MKTSQPAAPRRISRPLTKTVLVALTAMLLNAPGAWAASDVVIKSDGTDSKVFPDWKVHFGEVHFGVPMAKLFGLDADNGLQPLPDDQRFPGDFFGTLAMNEFLAATADHKERGIVYSFGGFNNRSSTGNPQDILKATFRVPLTNASGLPLGGSGTRWIVFQHGPFAGAGAGAGGGGGGAAKSDGRGYATLQPPSTPLKAWAARIKSFPSLPCESEDDFRERVRANIEAELLAKGRTRKQVDKYLKLVDDSKFKDPIENFVLRIPATYSTNSLNVEIALLIEPSTFLKVAEFINNFSIAITNDPALASTDPNNQPAGQVLLGSDTLPATAGGGGVCGASDSGDVVSLMMSDIEVDAVAIVDAQPDLSLADNAVEVVFHSIGTVENTGAGTQYLDIDLADGTLYRVPYDQAVGDTGKEIALDLADTVNVWPHEGAYAFTAEAHENSVIVHHRDGIGIRSARLVFTNRSEVIEEELRMGACREGEACRGQFETPVVDVELRRATDAGKRTFIP